MLIYAYTLFVMKTSGILYISQSKVFISIGLLALALFIFLPSQAQPFSGSSSPTQLFEGSVWIFPQFTEPARGVAYAPLSPFSPSRQHSLSPVLYGPGGTPIGGLPISNGSLFLLGCVIIYAGWRFFRRRKLIKKAYFSSVISKGLPYRGGIYRSASINFHKRIDVSSTGLSGGTVRLNDREQITTKIVI